MASYVDYEKKSNSTVWKYFLREEKGQTAMCKNGDCKKILKIGGGSTKGLYTHLFSIHKINLTTANNSAKTLEADEAPTKKSKPLTKYFPMLGQEEKSLPATLARLTALDGISFNVICHSSDLRAGLTATGFKSLPTTVNTVRKLVVDYSNKIKHSIITEIAHKKNPEFGVGERYSLSFDEWTSLRNRRYLNINLHAQNCQFWNLGLVRVKGSMPADKSIWLLEQKLAVYGLNLRKDIVGIMTDGASVMKKVGSLLPVNQQLCFAHGVQLAVIDVLYQKQDLERKTDEQSYEGEESEVEDNFSESNEDEDFSGNEELVDLYYGRRHGGYQCDIIEVNCGSVIKKVRKLIVMFKRSPAKNDVLQKYITAEFGKQLTLTKDCKTRWNSLLLMLERVYLLRNCIQKALIDISPPEGEYFALSKDEIKMVSAIINALVPVKATVDALCRRDANLFTADAAITFMLKKLKDANNVISQKLHSALILRMQQRRTDISGVLQYLHNGRTKVQSESETEFVTVHSSIKCRKLIVELLERLDASSPATSPLIAHDSEVTPTYSNKAPPEIVPDSSELLSESLSCSLEEPLNISDELNEAIKKAHLPRIPIRCQTLSVKIQKEMLLFENGGTRGDFLQRAYEFLMTIKPTSVESERAFSAAGLFATKIRSRLGDETLDALCFLKSYFKNNNV